MAIKIAEEYVNTNPPDANYPGGSIKNSTTPTSTDGTPVDNKWGNDMIGFFQAILLEAGIAASGVPDTAIDSQYLQGMKAISGSPVNDMFALVSIPVGQRKSANTLGFFVTFPQSVFTGGGEFVYQPDLAKSSADGGYVVDPDNTGGFDGTVSTLAAFLTAQGGGGGNGCWVKVREKITPEDYGALSFPTDDTLAIQSAIDYAETLPDPSVIDFLSRTYLYSTLLVSVGGISLVGNATLLKSGATGDGLVFDGVSSLIFKNQLGDLSFAANVTQTAGVMVKFNKVAHANTSNIRLLGSPFPAFKGVEIAESSQNFFSFCQINSCVDDGFKAIDCNDTYINNSRSDNNGGHGWLFDTCAGLYPINSTAFGNGRNGFKTQKTIVPVLVDDNKFQFFVNCTADSSGEHNWDIDSLNTGMLTNCWGSTQTADGTFYGFAINDVNGLELSNCIAINNKADGLVIAGTSTDVVITGGQYKSNGVFAAAPTKDGIRMTNAGNVIINGANVTSNAGNGVKYTTATTDLTLTGNRVVSNAAEDYSFDVRPTNFAESANTTDVPSVASATNLPLPAVGSIFNITGTTTINSIDNAWAGRRVTLIFDDALAVGDTGSLILSGSFNTSAGDTLSLVADGTNWYETGRSVN